MSGMPSITSVDVHHIANQMDAFYTAYRCCTYLDELLPLSVTNTPASHFWKFDRFLLLYTLLINWNEAFGITSGQSRWKELTIEHMEYNRLYYAQSGYHYAQWNIYRREINELKNTFIQFPDHYHHTQIDYDLTGISVSVQFTHDWLIALAKQNPEAFSSEELQKWPLQEDNVTELWRNEARSAYRGSSS